MKIWKRVKLKNWCCECCNGGSYKQHKKKHKQSLKKRARAMLKKLLNKEE